MHPWGISGLVWCSSDARRTWGIWLRLELLAMVPGSWPTRLRRVPADSDMLDTCLVPCVIGFCPLGREGPSGCQVGPYISLAMEKQLHASVFCSFFWEEEALHVHQSCQSQQHQQTDKGSL